MSDEHETWQVRVEDLYQNVAELYAHVDIQIAMFDRNLVELSPPGKAMGGSMVAIARRVVETGEPQLDVALDATGRRRAHAYPLRDRDTVVGVVCVVDDDGARRELFVRCAMALFDGYRQNEVALLARERLAREEAQRANHQRDQFMASCAHELGGPTAAILLWERVLRTEGSDTETRQRALDAIRECAASQSLLVADLLDVSRAISGKLHVERLPCDVARVVTAAVASSQSAAAARHTELSLELDPDLGEVLGDARRLRQILDNLLSNAVKCTRDGRIVVQARHDPSSIEIRISDTGRGIPASLLPRLFDAFMQGAGTEMEGGLGLGLAIAQQLVALHGGTLVAASEGADKGATFTATFPRLRERAAGESSLRTHEKLDGIRILVVDDDRRLLDALALLLGQAGAITATAGSAADAFDTLMAGSTDILLSDIAMPEEDGCSLVRRLRASEGNSRKLPAIALTALHSTDAKARALAAGFDLYLTKPIDLPLLVASIQQLAAATARATLT